MRKAIVAGLTFLLLAGFVIIGALDAKSGDSKASTAKKPEFTLESIDGKKVSLSDYRGKVVLVNFWATWCPPCVHEIPDLVKLRKAYNKKDFEVLGIVISSKEPQVQKMVEHFGIDYPVLWGTVDAVNAFGNIPAIPRSFLINRKGEIVEDIEGMGNYEMFESLVKKYLEG